MSLKNKQIDNSTHNLFEMTVAECKQLCKKIRLEYLDGYENRIVKMALTKQIADREGDVVLVKGVNTINYLKNPTVQFVHDTHSFPVGRCLGITKEGDYLFGLTLFLDERVDTSGMSDRVFKYVKSGAMNGVSIGFSVMSAHRPDEKEKERYGIKNEWGKIYDEVDLLEYSIVPVPCNQEAVEIRKKSIENLSEEDRNYYELNFLNITDTPLEKKDDPDNEDLENLTNEEEAAMKKTIKTLVERLNKRTEIDKEITDQIAENNKVLKHLSEAVETLTKTLIGLTEDNSELEKSTDKKNDSSQDLYEMSFDDINKMINSI